ncbi:MAG: hypothetical protein ABI036_03600 [Fibrobacteria bacterium]
MRKAIRSPYAQISAPAMLAALMIASAAPALAHELKDISLLSAGGQTHLQLTFVPNGSDGDYPLYSEKADLVKGTIFLSFLETETAYPLGRHALEEKSPDLEEIQIKKVTTPSGKSLLGLELKFKQPLTSEAELQTAPNGVLKVMLGKAKTKAKYAWSLTASLKAGDAYLSAKAEAAPAGGTGNTQVTQIFLKEVKLNVASAQADLILAFDPPLTAPFVPHRGAKDTTWLQATVVNAVSGLAQKDYTFPKNPLFKRIKSSVQGRNLILRIQIAAGGSVKSAPGDVGMVLSGAVKDGATLAWSSLSPEGATASAKVSPVKTPALSAPAATASTAAVAAEEVPDGPDPVRSAFEEGHALEAGKATNPAKTAQGLSSSRIFSPGQSAKTMVLYKDSVALKTAPGAKGTTIRKIPIGEKLTRIGDQGGNLRVVSGSDTGYIASGQALYEDELTKVQEKTIQGRIEAKQSLLAAAEAKAAEARIRQEEKARKAEELARKKTEEEAAKALAKAHADSLKAEKKARALAVADSVKAAAEAERMAKKAAAEAAKLAAKAAADSAKAAKVAAKAAADSAKAAKAFAKAHPQPAIAQPPQGQTDQLRESQAPGAVGAPQIAAGKNPAASPNADAAVRDGRPSQGGPKLAIADNPELAAKLAQEKLAADDEKKRIEPEEKRISYNSYGRRDPFIPVEQGASDNGIDIDQMKVVGIIWQSQQPMAVLEHNKESGVSFTIKEGDPVHNGRVARISRDAVTFDISEYGIARSYSLKLVSSKEGARK